MNDSITNPPTATNFDNEEWREIGGYGGMYSMSRNGLVRNNRNGRYLRGVTNKNRVRVYTLWSEGGSCSISLPDLYNEVFKKEFCGRPATPPQKDQPIKLAPKAKAIKKKPVDNNLPDEPDLPGESWRDIPGYEGIYRVSDMGRLKRIKRSKGRAGIRNPSKPHKSGYVYIKLAKSGVNNREYLHRLVMRAFKGPCPDGCEVNHINGNKMDNRLVNLEYVSREENMHHAWHEINAFDSVIGESSPKSKLTSDQVRDIRRMYQASGYTQKRLAQMFDVSHTTINHIVRRRTWSHIP